MGAVFSQNRLLTDPNEFANSSYDYVIVGGGTAGCVLASRLSEDPHTKVLLVEAGGSHQSELFAKIPVAAAQLLRTSKDWGYSTVPQPALNNREVYYARGKLLGGSGSINALVYQHCSPSDYDEWEKKGATGWGYRDLAPYFRKSEKFTPHPLYPGVKPEDRGDSGLWHTSYGYAHPICDNFIESAKELGIPHNPDINTPRGSIGATKFMTYVDSKGQRSSTATAYLPKEVLARKNLTIAIDTITTKVLFSSDRRPRAIGVEVAQNETSPRFQVAARKEVILAAGAVNTPQLLLLSGIGPQADLEDLNIPLVKDLPMVGNNLHDHPLVPIICRAKSGTTLDYMADPLKAVPVLLQWFLTGTGPATSNGGEAALFVRSDDPSLPFTSNGLKLEPLVDNTSGPDSPDIEIGAAPAGYRPLPRGSNGLTLIPILTRPMSVGRLCLASSSPFDKPKIDPNFLAHPNDMKMMVRAVRLSLRLARSSALAPMLELKPDSEDTTDLFWPGDADPDRITDGELEDWIRINMETTNHCAGTARIGTDETDGVVDPELKVFGIDGLRVVDASIFPTMVSGHPTAPVVAIAEKASDLILLQ
ncbi:aryl-alcohol oxidase [Jaapia argillacea MUCL 33604]|uniref:Aryl-alcohol oxidase n=1 Tax=Jaapia argillacea MUCL 33604 TaxID=933084 RepID=A0A067PS55_9AGAM|nr:aryl-alcohol oxidase [Jaapia argillacea MUCL 33604]